MNEVVERFFAYASAIIRYRWYAFLVAIICCIAGWVVVICVPDTFNATGRIYVDTKSILQPLLKGLAVDIDVNQEISAMQQSLLTRPNLEEVANRTGLSLGMQTQQHENLIKKLRRSIKISANGQNIFVIDVVYRDPKKAAEIVQALIAVFVESSVGLSRDDMASASRFLDNQINDYELQLEEAENRVAAFKQKNLDYLSVPGGFQSSVDAAKKKASSIDADLKDARMELGILKQEMASTPQTIEPSATRGSSIADLDAKLTNMLTRYTESHPDVIALRRTIDNLKKIGDGASTTAAAAAANVGSAPMISIAPTLVANPAYAELKLRIIDRETAVAKLQEKLRLACDEVKELESRAFVAPQIEAQMTKLNRDYDVLKAQYEQLLSRREQAKLSRDREENGDKLQFRVIEPPKVPIAPQGPNRPLLLTAVLPIACGAGMSFAVALGLLYGAYSSAKQLSAELGLPVIGTVSLVHHGRGLAKRRAEGAVFAVLCAGVLGIYFVLMVLDTQVGLGKVVSVAVESKSLGPAVDLVSRALGAALYR